MMGNDGKDMEHPADLDLSSSSSFPFPTITSSGTPCSSYMYNHQHSLNPRKKRTKLVKINQPNSLLGNNKPPKRHRKPDPLAPKITRPCTECGKKFWSWKALFGHMRCHPERQWRGINPPPNYRRDPPPRPPIAAAATTATTSSPSIPHQKEYYFLGATEQVNDMSEEEHEVAACLLMLANSDHNGEGGGSSQIHYDQEATCRFECSSCKKVFGSHQALGGHRASHKNVKGCFAITRTSCDGCQIPAAAAAADHIVKENLEEEEEEEEEDHNMMVVLGHRCDICSRVFPSGQALGGHKRCHWEKAEEASSSMLNNDFRGPSSLLSKQAAVGACGCGLDLNLPAPIEHEHSPSSTLTLDLTLGL